MPERGVVLICAQALFFTLETTAIHRLGATAPMALVLARSAGGLGLVLVLSAGRPPWRSSVPRMQAARCSLSLASLAAYIVVFGALPLADATAITYLQPVFWSLIGVVWLGESMTRRLWCAVGLGFAAALLIIKPAFATMSWFYLLAFVGTALNSTLLPLSRRIEEHDPALTVMFYVSISGAVASLLTAPGLPPPSPWLLGVAVFGPIGQLCGILAVRHSNLAALSPWGYVRLPLALVFGWVLFDEIPDVASLLGALVIIIVAGFSKTAIASPSASRSPVKSP
jgi:drug/metabolite transporter (DMT)-like permease